MPLLDIAYKHFFLRNCACKLNKVSILKIEKLPLSVDICFNTLYVNRFLIDHSAVLKS